MFRVHGCNLSACQFKIYVNPLTELGYILRPRVSRDLRTRGNTGHIVPTRRPFPVIVLQVNRENVERSRVNEKCFLSLKGVRHTSPSTDADPRDGENCRHRQETKDPSAEKHSGGKKSQR